MNDKDNKAGQNVPVLSPYYGEVWDYKKTDPKCIQRVISSMNWNDVVSNKTIGEKIKSLNNIVLNISNIFRNFISCKIIRFNYKYPNWMNPKTISSLRNRSKLTQRYYCNTRDDNKNLLTANSNECSNMILKGK